MIATTLFLAQVGLFLVLWTNTEHSGRKYSQIFCLTLIFVSVLLVKPVFLLVICVEIFIFQYLKTKKRQRFVPDELFLVNELILQMKSGTSFERAVNKIQSEWGSFPKTETNGLFQILLFCKNNGSLAFRVLVFFREVEKLRQKLHTKQKNVSLQARAQAVVSVLLYLIVFCSQWAWNDDFKKVFHQSSGRLVVTLSFVLMCFGGVFVFKLGKCKDLEL